MTPSAPLSNARKLFRLVRVLAGIMIVCIALMLTHLTGRVGYLWLARDRFISATLEVDQFFSTINREPSLVGHVRPPGTEVSLQKLPYDFHVFASASAVTSTLIAPDAAKGRTYPVWFNSAADAWADDAQIEYQRDWPSLPTGATFAKALAGQLAVLLLGVFLVWPPIRALLGELAAEKAKRIDAVPDGER